MLQEKKVTISYMKRELAEDLKKKRTIYLVIILRYFQLMTLGYFIAQSLSLSAFHCLDINEIQLNLNGSNIFGTMEICSRHG